LRCGTPAATPANVDDTGRRELRKPAQIRFNNVFDKYDAWSRSIDAKKLSAAQADVHYPA